MLRQVSQHRPRRMFTGLESSNVSLGQGGKGNSAGKSDGLTVARKPVAPDRSTRELGGSEVLPALLLCLLRG